MPYPMISGTHLNFYLQNRENVKIEEYNNEILFTILDDNLGKEIYKRIYGFEPVGNDMGHFFFGGKEIDKYLDKIGD